MSEYDKWEVTTVLPGAYMEFDEWVFLRPDMLKKEAATGVVCHRHTEDNKTTIYVTQNNRCRVCGEEAPPGVLFMAKTFRLKTIEG